MSQSNKIPDFLKMASDIKKNASRFAATESVNFFKNSFTRGGFTDVSFVAWKKPANPLAGYRVLYKTGNLQRSIRKQSESAERVIIESDLDYAEIHNNGGFITVTEKMKRFFWAKYYEFGGKKSKSNNAKAEFCKAMALKETGSKIKIEQRQFMGESKTMMDGFEKWFGGHVEIVFKNNLNTK